MSQPIVTLFCAFSRDNFTKQWLRDLDHFEHDVTRTRIAIIVDGDFQRSERMLRKYFKEKPYASVHFQVNRDHIPNGARLLARRNRIAFVKEQSKDLIRKAKTEYVLSLEDDTAFRGKSLKRLLDPFKKMENIGFVSGLQVGRWGVKYVGAWNATVTMEGVVRLESITPNFDTVGNQYIYISAGGFYFYLTPANLYLEYNYVWTDEIWGPDVLYGLWLKSKGYGVLADTASVVGHRTEYKGTLWPDGTITKIEHYKDAEGKWQRHDKDQTSNYRAPQDQGLEELGG